MALKTITIRGKEYPEPSVDRLKRKQAKKFQEISKQIERSPSGVPIDMLWDMAEILVPNLPEDVLDDLELGEIKEMIESAGIMNFSEDAGGGEASEELGESSAS